ncbi:MAG: putative lipid II flippase FtsW [Gemmatimonadota bacterium]
MASDHAMTGAAALTARRGARSASRLGVGWEGPLLLLCALVLLSFGLVVVYSASTVMAKAEGLPDHYFLTRQAVGAGLGLAGLVVLARMDYRLLRRLAWPLLGLVWLALILVVLPWTEAVAPEANGARRWLLVGGVSLQPSEFAKFAMVAWTAALAVKKQDRLRSLSRGLMPFLIIWTAVALPVLFQPDLSTALLAVLLAVLVVLAAGGRIGHFVLLGLAALPAVWTVVSRSSYRLQRIDAFLDPTRDPAGLGYQINQSLVALGSGGVLGRGVGQGQQKFGFLPEPHNDFIFAMIGEEWGLLGTGSVVLLIVAITLIGYRIARNSPDLFGSLLAIGMTNLIVAQALLHMAVTTALVPTTGLTLPFISYGRSSLLVCLAAVGVLISVGRAGAEARP